MHVIDERGSSARRNGLHTILIAAAIIAVGFMFLGKNLGIVPYGIFRIFISWQMLLIVLGLSSLISGKHTGGAVLVGVGLFFLVPRLTGVGFAWIGTYWPLLIILVGVILILKVFRPDRHHYHGHNKKFSSDTSYTTEDGFVNSHISFGSVNQIVLDPVFKGARISNNFGGTILDLRRTSLSAPETYIDIDCSFGGVEIFVPYNWTVKTELRNFFSGSDDKRYAAGTTTDLEHKLIIRGNVSFGGVEIKG